MTAIFTRSPELAEVLATVTAAATALCTNCAPPPEMGRLYRELEAARARAYAAGASFPEVEGAVDAGFGEVDPR